MASCHPNEPIFLNLSHYICSIFSVPVYATAFLVLFFKCPNHFDTKYRNYLVSHIISGVFLEIHISVFWRPDVILPVPIICSSGFSSDYSAANFTSFVYLLMFTGVSALSILIYRMRAVILYAEENRFQNLPIYFCYIFYIFGFFTIIVTFFINFGLNNQTEYKMKMEEKFGTFPEYFWCQSCFFMVFDSISFILFFIFGYITMTSAFLSAAFSAFVTYRILNSNTLRLSRKTAAIQKNVLSSLVAAFMVHLILLAVPLLFYFSANFISIKNPYVAYNCIIMIQEHGACSAFTLLLTSNLLRKSAKELLCTSTRFAKRPKEAVFRIATHGNPSEI